MPWKRCGKGVVRWFQSLPDRVWLSSRRYLWRYRIWIRNGPGTDPGKERGSGERNLGSIVRRSIDEFCGWNGSYYNNREEVVHAWQERNQARSTVFCCSPSQHIQAQHLARFALGYDFEWPATNLAVSRESLCGDARVHRQVEALAAKGALDGLGHFHTCLCRNQHALLRWQSPKSSPFLVRKRFSANR